jgi:hypothetical protein
MATVTIKQTVDALVRFLKVEAGVRYWEDADVNDEPDEDGKLIPFRVGDTWCPTIDLDGGFVVDWPKATTANVHYKVCDEGVYTLLDDTGEPVRQIEGYVPKIMSPGGSGYGDYIIMSIDGEGSIADWRVSLDEFDGDDE